MELYRNTNKKMKVIFLDDKLRKMEIVGLNIQRSKTFSDRFLEDLNKDFEVYGLEDQETLKSLATEKTTFIVRFEDGRLRGCSITKTQTISSSLYDDTYEVVWEDVDESSVMYPAKKPVTVEISDNIREKDEKRTDCRDFKISNHIFTFFHQEGLFEPNGKSYLYFNKSVFDFEQ